MPPPVPGVVADAFVVKHKGASVAGWPRRIKTVVLIHGDVIPARHIASPVIVRANAVGIGCIDRLNQIFAHQVSAVIGASEARKLAILQDDRLKFRKDCFAQFAASRAAREAINQDGGRGRESEDDERDADELSFDQPVLHWLQLKPFSRWRSFQSCISLGTAENRKNKSDS